MRWNIAIYDYSAYVYIVKCIYNELKMNSGNLDQSLVDIFNSELESMCYEHASVREKERSTEFFLGISILFVPLYLVYLLLGDNQPFYLLVGGCIFAIALILKLFFSKNKLRKSMLIRKKSLLARNIGLSINLSNRSFKSRTFFVSIGPSVEYKAEVVPDKVIESVRLISKALDGDIL